MNILANIIGVAINAIVAFYEDVYTDEFWNYYTDENNEHYIL